MSTVTTPVQDHLDHTRDEAVETLKTYLRFASVSADPAHREDVLACAEYTADLMRKAGLEAQIVPTEGHPIVLGESPRVDGPTLLIYGHYDVQPPDPLNLWRHGPFEPVVEGENLVARGSSDDKGQVLAHLEALTAYQATGTPLPCNIQFIIEGEEEVGSLNLEKWLKGDGGASFAPDGIVLSDNQQLAAGVPAICYSLRGIAYMEIILEGPDRDLHSGTYGGIVPNPANALARIVGAMRDDDNRITIPGFYDDVRELEDWEREQFRNLPFDEDGLMRDLGLEVLPGEKGFSTLERKWARPTLDVNGLAAGYGGEGAKTVIPARAMAKVSMRLVADQDPEDIADKFEQFVRDRCPEGLKVTINRYHNSSPVVMETDHPAVQAGVEALEKGFGKRPVYIRDGASIPIVSLFHEVMQAPVVMLGFGRPDDNLHSPNEKFNLEDFQKARRTCAHFIDAFGRQVKPRG